MENLRIRKGCFDINGVQYYLRLIPKSRRRSDSKTGSLKSLIMALTKINYYTKTRGRVEYTAGESKKVKRGRFEEKLVSEPHVDFYYLRLRLRENPRKEINLESYSSDSRIGGINITAKEKAGFMRWKKIPCSQLQ